MSWHIYLIPIEGTGIDKDGRRPKYMTELGTDWSMIDYGQQPVGLVAADLDVTQAGVLEAHADVSKIPDNLDQSIGGALTQVSDALETMNIPAQWITGATSYREVLRALWGFFAFLQRYAEITNSPAPILSVTTNLNLRLNQLSAAVRQNLKDTALSLGLNIDAVVGTTTLRQMLREIADQWGDRSFQLGGITV
jgi:hypothetical protein